MNRIAGPRTIACPFGPHEAIYWPSRGNPGYGELECALCGIFSSAAVQAIVSGRVARFEASAALRAGVPELDGVPA